MKEMEHCNYYSMWNYIFIIRNSFDFKRFGLTWGVINNFINCQFFFLAPYFLDCISEQDLDEMNIEIIRNTLYKVFLYIYCKHDTFGCVFLFNDLDRKQFLLNQVDICTSLDSLHKDILLQ